MFVSRAIYNELNTRYLDLEKKYLDLVNTMRSVERMANLSTKQASAATAEVENAIKSALTKATNLERSTYL